MDKYITISDEMYGRSDWGPTTHVIRHRKDLLEKTALAKEAVFDPRIQEFINAYTSNPAYLDVVVVPLGAFEAWGCFPKGTPIWTQNGQRPIEVIEVGDLVLTHKNRWRPVTNTYTREATELSELYVVGMPHNLHPALAATPNHPIWAVRRDEFIDKRRKHFYYQRGKSKKERRHDFVQALEFDWIPIGELQKGDYVAQPFPITEDSPLQEKWGDSNIGFLMGLYAADGCCSDRYDHDMLPETDKTYIAVFTIGSHKVDLKHRILEILSQYGHISTPRNPVEAVTRIDACWADFARLCRDHIGRSASSKHLSQDLLTMPKGWQEAFLEGYFSGDGCIRLKEKGNGTIRANSASLELLWGIRQMAARQGWIGQINGRHNTKSSWYAGNPIYTLSISGSQFRNDPGPINAYIHPDGFILSPVKKVREREEKLNVFNLEVDEDNSYVAQGVAVHNSNSNGDSFEEMWVEPEHRDWGHKSFETHARAFLHHRNKNPEKAFGSIPLAVYEPSMRRIELIWRLDREKAERVGAGRLIQDIDKDKPWDVSMGARVSYDLCSKCGNRAKNTREYCDDLKHHMNTIEPDGTLVCAFNPRPLFFDLSGVIIPAAKESKILAKLASDLSIDLSKLGSAKIADEKVADLIKRFPAIYKHVVRPMQRCERSMPESIMQHLCGCRFPETLATTGAMGIVLKPREFQRIYLHQVGRPDAAEELHDRRVIFGPKDARGAFQLNPHDISLPLSQMLQSLLGERSLLQPFVSRRILVVLKSPPTEDIEPVTEKTGGVLDEVGQAYTRYINGLGKLPSFLKSAMRRCSSIYDPVLAARYDPWTKTAGKQQILLPALGLVLPTYLLSAKWRSEAIQGRDLSTLQEFISEYPTTSALGLLTGAHYLGRHLRA